jgi:hypothetical protein
MLAGICLKVKLYFRPHHFLCTVAFQGEGYSPKFVQNYWEIVKILKSSSDILIEVNAGLDSICYPCPNHSHGKCSVEAKIRVLDQRHSNVLEIFPEDLLTWAEAKQIIREKMTLEKFHHACSGCEWKSLGVCEIALKQLHDKL